MSGVRLRLKHVLMLVVPLALVAAAWARVGREVRVGRQSACLANLTFIGHELFAYRERHGRYPPLVTAGAGGRPMHSWRTILVSEADRDGLGAYSFAEPWDGPGNAGAVDRRPNYFGCPNDRDGPSPCTNYVALYDPAAPDDWGAVGAGGRPAGGGPIPVVVEHPNSTIPWTEPRDLGWDDLPTLGEGGDPSGLAVLYSDGSVRRMPRDALVREARPAGP